jgi:hypothetical protein
MDAISQGGNISAVVSTGAKRHIPSRAAVYGTSRLHVGLSAL